MNNKLLVPLAFLLIPFAISACGGGGGGGSSCVGPVDCAAGEYCNFNDGACGAAGGGACESIPIGCAADIAPVCSCEKLTFDNPCYAAAAAQAVIAPGACS